MTEAVRKPKYGFLCAYILYILLFLSATYSPLLADGVREGMHLAVFTTLPAVFPSMILSDFALSVPERKHSPLASLFSFLFKISKQGARVFAVGLLCGFPVGAKMTAELYRRGVVGKEEAERLAALSLGASPAFLVAGVGVGMYKNAFIGILLYFISLFSGILTGLLFAVGKVPSKTESSFSPPPFRPVESVRRAGVNAVTLCAFVCLFGAVGYVIRATMPIPILVSFLLSVTEISGACAYIGNMVFPLVLRGTLTAFAVAFSGLSVLWQAMSFLSDTDLRFGRFFAIKAVQSFLATLLGFICFSVL